MRAAAFNASDLARAPNLVSLARLPLAVIFPFTGRCVPAALSVLAMAGLSDVLDGFLARRLHAETALGAVIDPLADKVFALSVVITLVGEQRLPAWGVPALLAREILEAPLLGWVLWRRRRRGEPPEETRSNTPGKLATAAQFAAVFAAIAAPGALPAALAAAAALAALAGILYWKREVERRPPPNR